MFEKAPEISFRGFGLDGNFAPGRGGLLNFGV
jgi:hypothetical protein